LQTYADNSGYRGARVADGTPSGSQTTGTSIIDEGSRSGARFAWKASYQRFASTSMECLRTV
jgi:hypothetical protein